MSPVVLMVCEKPSIAESISRALAHGHFETRRAGRLVIHEFSAPFQSYSYCNFKVLGLFGHIFSTDFEPRYNNWSAVDPIDLFDAPVIKKPEKGNVIAGLSSEARGCDYVVLCLDCDREGENICFEVLSVIKPVLAARRDQQIFRARFSAVTEADMRHAMANLTVPNANEAQAVDVRQELDLKVGVAFTRYQTQFFKGKYGDLKSDLISYGPCQTPTLGFCVERHDLIAKFQPERYFVIQPNFSFGSTNGSSDELDSPAEWERGRLFDEDVARVLFARCHEAGKSATVLEYEKKKDFQARPVPMNTVTFLKACSSQLGLPSYQALSIAEGIYTRGYMSYPRTESTAYPPTFDLRGLVQKFAGNGYWKSAAEVALSGSMHGRGGVDAGDHPPLTPTAPLSPNSPLSGIEWQVYELVTRHFLASLAPDVRLERQNAVVELGGERFRLRARTVLDPGYTQIQHWLRLSDTTMPALKAGQSLHVNSLKLINALTSPPPLLSESDLISMMEKNGIGTDASIPTHIQSITTRQYVEVVGSRREMQPTQLGIMLVHGYHRIDSDLVLPAVRSEVEKLITLIAEGHADKDAVLKHSITNFRLKFEFFRSNIAHMDELFESSFSKLAECGKSFSHCGQCHRLMNLIQTRPARLYCQTCDIVCNLPDDASFRVMDMKRCPLDGFELVACSFKSVKPQSVYDPSADPSDSKSQTVTTTFALCPLCYTHPAENVSLSQQASLGERGMRCQRCPHPSCPYALSANTICPCENPGCEGVLVFDPSSSPNWRINCSSCGYNISFKPFVKSVALNKTHTCDHCGARTLKVALKEKGAPDVDPSFDLNHVCIICADNLPTIASVSDSTGYAAPSFGFGGRGRGRGRGRGGRGRGRGRGRGGRRGGRGRGGRGGRDADDGYETVGGHRIFNPFA